MDSTTLGSRDPETGESHRHPLGSQRLASDLRSICAAGGLLLLAAIAVFRSNDVESAFCVGLFLLAALLGLGRASNIEATHAGASSRTSTKGWTWLVVYGSVAAGSSLIVQSWFTSGTVIAGGDVGVPEGTAWLARIFEPWIWSGNNVGGPGALQEQLPWAFVLKVTTELGGSAALAQRVFFTLLFAGTAVAILAFLKALRFSIVPAVIGCAAYVLNPFMISTVGDNPVYMATVLLVAALPAILISAAHGRMRNSTASLLLVVLSPVFGFVFVDPANFLAVLLAGAAVPFAFTVIGGRRLGRHAAITTLRLGIVLALASAYWIVPAFLQVTTSATSQLAPASSWVWTEGRSTLTNALWLNTTWGWSYSYYYPEAPVYSHFPLEAMKYGLPILAFAALLIRPRRGDNQGRQLVRFSSFAAVGALVVLILSTGTRFPAGPIFTRLYELPYGWLLREPGRFLVLAMLGYAIMLASSVAWLQRHLVMAKDRSLPTGLLRAGQLRYLGGAGLAFGVCVVFATAAGYPELTGEVVPETRTPLPPDRVHFPEYWSRMAERINSTRATGPLVVLPPDRYYQVPYKWQYDGNDAFIQQLLNRPVITPTTQAYFTPSGTAFQTVNAIADGLSRRDWRAVSIGMEALHSKLLLVRRDVSVSYLEADPNDPGAVDPRLIAPAAKSDPGLRLMQSIGPLDLYEARGDLASKVITVGHIVTTTSRSPDLTALTLFAPNTVLVKHEPISGLMALQQVTQPSSVTERGLRYDFRQTAGTYSVAVKSSPTAWTVDPPGTAQIGRGRGQIAIFESERDLIGAQWSALGDCDATQSMGTGLAIRRVVGPDSIPALALTARQDIACIHQSIGEHGSFVAIALKVRTPSGRGPAICLWDATSDSCLSTPTLPTSASWKQYAAVVPVPSGDQLYLFLDAYGAAPGGKVTVNEFASAAVFDAPAAIDLLSSTDTQTNSVYLASNWQGYNPNWALDAPTASDHVIVNGMFNGWLTHSRLSVVRTRYRPAALIKGSLFVTVVAAIGVFVGAMWVGRRRPLARTKHP